LHSHEEDEEKGKSSLRYGLFSPRYYEVTLSSFRSSTTSTLLYIQHHHSRALSQRADQNNLHLFDRLHTPSRHDECLSISRLFSCTCTITFLPPFLLYPTRQSGLRPDPAVPRSANCLVFTLLFPSPPSIHSRSVYSPSHCTLSQRPLIDTLRSRLAYIFSNPTLI
jgi:hypothetical protein